MPHSNSGDSLMKNAPPLPPPNSSPAPIAPPASATKLKSEKTGKKGDSPRSNPSSNQSASNPSAHVVLVQVPVGAVPGTTVRVPGPDGNSVSDILDHLTHLYRC